MQFDLFARAANTLPVPAAKTDLEERLSYVRRTGWVPYRVGLKALTLLGQMIEAPNSHRPPCLLIHGDTNNGKTTIALKFAKDRNGSAMASSEHTTKPVLLVQNPPFADLGAFLGLALRALDAPTPRNARTERRLDQLLTVMRTADVRMLVIDEIHNILTSKVDQRALYLNGLKFLSNELQIPVVLIGTIEAMRALQSDQQLGNRFEPHHIPRWPNDENYARFLAGMCSAMRLGEGGNWRSKPLVTRFHAMSEGLTGETWKLMCRAAETAIKTQREKIDEDTLDATPWTRPSERRRGG